MIEIGTKRERVVRTMVRLPNGKRTMEPKLEGGQPVTQLVANEPVRVTRGTLGGHFCRDSGRKLVVALRDGDVLELRPHGTRQRMTATLFDIYAWMIRSTAMKAQMEKLREKKAKMEEARALRRLRRPIRQ